MKTLTINLPESIDVGGPAGHERAMPTANWSDEFVLNMMLHGIKQRRTDRFSVVKSADGTAKAQEALAELDARLIAGELPMGGGGRGPSMTVEEAGWVAYFNAKDAPVKLDKEKANSKNLDKYLAALTRKAIWPGVAKFLAGKTKEEQVTFHKEKLPALIAKHLPGMIATEEARTEDGSPGWYINAERVKRSGKIEKKVTEIEIEIEIE